MKTRILLTMIGAAALTAITFPANADLLSPRAAGNQLITVSGTTSGANLAAVGQGFAALPRATGNEVTSVAGVANDVNPAMACRNMTASAKAIQACAANPTAVMPCCARPVAAAN